MLLKATQASVPRGHEIGFVLDATQQCADVADVSLACGSRWLQYPLPTAVADRLMQDPKLKGYIFPAPTPTLPYAGQQRQYNEVLMAEDVSIRYLLSCALYDLCTDPLGLPPRGASSYQADSAPLGTVPRPYHG